MCADEIEGKLHCIIANSISHSEMYEIDELQFKKYPLNTGRHQYTCLTNHNS